MMEVVKRNNVRISGQGNQAMIFAHGYGCDQNMWRFVIPAFEEHYRIIAFDHVGAGNSDLASFDDKKYSNLEGYASDIIEIIHELDLRDVIFIGHSVAAMMGVLAAQRAPGLFSKLILVAPSASYIDDGDYIGGFSRSQINELLDALNNNHMGWSISMAPVIMGNPDRKELSEELAASFCRTDPEIAKHFARTTFLSDTRDILSGVQVPTLILQCSNDVIAPLQVGEYIHKQIPGSELVILNATGHCPNLSSPTETTKAIASFLS